MRSGEPDVHPPDSVGSGIARRQKNSNWRKVPSRAEKRLPMPAEPPTGLHLPLRLRASARPSGFCFLGYWLFGGFLALTIHVTRPSSARRARRKAALNPELARNGSRPSRRATSSLLFTPSTSSRRFDRVRSGVESYRIVPHLPGLVGEAARSDAHRAWMPVAGSGLARLLLLSSAISSSPSPILTLTGVLRKD